MTIAKIAVAAAVYSIDKPYDYLLPKTLEEKANPGRRVVVPFGKGNRRSEGIILWLESLQEQRNLKMVESLLDEEPVMDDRMIRLAAFLRERYFCTMFDAVRAMLPAGLWFHARDKIVLTALGQSIDLQKILKYPEAVKVAQCLKDLGGQAEEKTLKRMLPQETIEAGLKYLIKKNMAISEGTLIRNVTDKTEQVAVLSVDRRCCGLCKNQKTGAAAKGCFGNVGSLRELFCQRAEIFYWRFHGYHSGAGKSGIYRTHAS